MSETPSNAAAQWDERYAQNAAVGAGRVSDLAGIIPILSLPERPRRAIDVGCGTGEDARWLARAGFDAVGVDVSVHALQIAQERTEPGTPVEWLVSDATALPAEDASCVLVTDRGCLHHVAPSDVPAYVAEVGRVLAAGGAWVIRDMLAAHQHHRELDPEGIRTLTQHTPLKVKRCDVTEAPHAKHGTMKVMVAVLRRK